MAPSFASNIVAQSLQERWAQLRSHQRIISKIKLLVEWDEGAAPRRANAVTVDVSHSGCMAVVGADLPLHRRVRLIHPESGSRSCVARPRSVGCRAGTGPTRCVFLGTEDVAASQFALRLGS